MNFKEEMCGRYPTVYQEFEFVCKLQQTTAFSKKYTRTYWRLEIVKKIFSKLKQSRSL